MTFLIGTVQEFRREQGFGTLRFDDGATMRFDITASSFQPTEGARIRAVVGPGLSGAPKVLRLLPLVSLDNPTTLHSVEDVHDALDQADAELTKVGPSPALRKKIAELDRHLPAVGGTDPDVRKRVRALLERIPGGVIAPGEPFGDGLLEELAGMPDATRAPLDALLVYAAGASGSKPSTKWLKAADAHVRGIGAGPLEETLVRWFARVEKPTAVMPDPHHYSYQPPLSDGTSDALKGLVWIASRLATPRIASAVGDLATTCFKKIPNFGAMSTKVGNACLWTLGAMSDRSIHGVAQLGRIKMRVRYAQALKLIDKALHDAAARANVSDEELVELGVPTCGLDADGVSEEEIGGATVRVSLASDGTVTTQWIRADGKAQASVPAEVKAGNGEDLKALKARIKDIETLLPAQAFRLEQMMIEPRDIPMGAFEERYLEHGLVARVARRLIWWIGETPAIYWEGSLVDVAGRRVAASAGARARLWHPLGRAPEEVLAWRRFIADRGITQPFKQAHREIYVITDAELGTETYSNRFAAHVLKQHQLAALLRQRGWTYTLQGGWDSANTPHKHLGSANLSAEFFVEAAWETGEQSESNIFLYVTTDQVRFLRPDGSPAPLHEVPALVFSETMRDLDLFVGVASIGNDPNWRDGGPAEGHDYWQSYAFGALSTSAETRKAVLENLLPKLKIRDRVRIDGRFLHVRGDLRTYKIHLGSTNILMEPNGQYLCIVPDHRASPAAELGLPFEGDAPLSIILSKALLLAADTKIKDESILRQIRN